MTCKDDLLCWQCGASITDQPLPLSRRAECAICGADLHTCRLCRFYDTGVAKHCREPIADEVKEKERANFCECFQHKNGAFTATDSSAAIAAETELGALFGLTQSGDTSSPRTAHGAQDALEKLFQLNEKKHEKTAESLSENSDRSEGKAD